MYTQYKIYNVMYNFYTEKTSNFILNPSKILFQTKWHFGRQYLKAALMDSVVEREFHGWLY